MREELVFSKGTANLAKGVQNARLARITDELVKVAGTAKECAWKTAHIEYKIKQEFSGNVSKDITAQFATINDFANYLGISPSTIHNDAKGFEFMMKHNQVPYVTKKGNKNPSVNYAGFSLNVGQAIYLASFKEEEYKALLAYTEEQGLTLDMVSVGKLKQFKKTRTFIAPTTDKPALESKQEEIKQEIPKQEETKQEEPKQEETKQEETKQEEIKQEAPKANPKTATAEQKLAIIDEIIENMLLYGITIKDITAREQQIGKKA